MSYFFNISLDRYVKFFYIYKNYFIFKFKNKIMFKSQINVLIGFKKIKKNKLYNNSKKKKKYNFFIINFCKNMYIYKFFLFLNYINFIFLKNKIYYCYKTVCGEGFFFIRGLFIIFFVDMLLIDDEPLWEPIEWSLVQSWILFIFIFAWIAENLISSRYGSYTGRDKRIWFSWYKTFWLIDSWYMISFGVAALFVITPFYYELTYSVAFIYSWWHWYTRLFFFKFISFYTLILILCFLIQISIRWLNWKKLFLFCFIINILLAYLLYTQFIISFFCYFTDPLWYRKNRYVDYIQLSHEPSKWGWGDKKRDHFAYHNVKTYFWFKNDGPFASAFLMFNFFFFISLFCVYIYWLILLRKLYSTKEISYTYTIYAISAIKQFYYFFFFMYILVIYSYISNYWRYPFEYFWILNKQSWLSHLFDLIINFFF